MSQIIDSDVAVGEDEDLEGDGEVGYEAKT